MSGEPRKKKVKIGGRQYQTKPDQQEFHREHKGATLQGDILYSLQTNNNECLGTFFLVLKAVG